MTSAPARSDLMIESGQLSPEVLARNALKLLFFAPHQVWPINTGARLRNYHLVRHLANRCSVTFAEMHHAGDERCKPPEDLGLEGIVTLNRGHTYTPYKILRGLAGPTPVTVLNCWSRRMAYELADSLKTRQFDAVQIEGIHLMEYLPLIREALGSPAIVVDWHNIESEMMWRYAGTSVNRLEKSAARRTARLTEQAEDRLLDTCGMHTVTSERERRKLLARRPSANIQVIPNGVDTVFYSAKEISQTSRIAGLENSKRSILFVGSMDFHANIDAVMWFSRTVWPEIARSHPDIHFTIVGRDPAREIQSLASDRVHVTGTVDDVRPYYALAVAAIVPIRSGSGTRLKILEAMAAGVPVVSTRLGVEGIDAERDVHILLADSGSEMAEAINRVLLSAETRNRISAAARDLVAMRYDWSIIGERLYRVHHDLVRARHHSADRNGS